MRVELLEKLDRAREIAVEIGEKEKELNEVLAEIQGEQGPDLAESPGFKRLGRQLRSQAEAVSIPVQPKPARARREGSKLSREVIIEVLQEHGPMSATAMAEFIKIPGYDRSVVVKRLGVALCTNKQIFCKLGGHQWGLKGQKVGAADGAAGLVKRQKAPEIDMSVAMLHRLFEAGPRTCGELANELAEVYPHLDKKELVDAINSFLAAHPKDFRDMGEGNWRTE